MRLSESHTSTTVLDALAIKSVVDMVCLLLVIKSVERCKERMTKSKTENGEVGLVDPDLPNLTLNRPTLQLP